MSAATDAAAGTPPPLAGPPATAEPPHRLAVEARFGELYALFMRNLVLSIATLSFYRFWGKTGIRRYLWSRVGVGGDAFEYGGTARELLVGFLFAFAVVGVPAIAIALWIEWPGEILVLVFFLVFFLLRHFAKFGALRYRVSRTHWRGIAGVVEGSVWRYAMLGIALDLLSFVSLGWTKPWADTVLLKYRYNRVWLGETRIAMSLTVSGLYGRYAIAWLIVAAGFVGMTWIIGENAETVLSLDILLLETVLLYLVLPVIWTLGMGVYNIALLRKAVAGTSAGQLRFAFAVTGWQLARFRLANYFLLLATIGFGLPWIMVRHLRFAARHLEIRGDVNALALRQRPNRRIHREGLAQYLGIDSF